MKAHYSALVLLIPYVSSISAFSSSSPTQPFQSIASELPPRMPSRVPAPYPASPFATGPNSQTASSYRIPSTPQTAPFPSSPMPSSPYPASVPSSPYPASVPSSPYPGSLAASPYPGSTSFPGSLPTVYPSTPVPQFPAPSSAVSFIPPSSSFDSDSYEMDTQSPAYFSSTSAYRVPNPPRSSYPDTFAQTSYPQDPVIHYPGQSSNFNPFPKNALDVDGNPLFWNSGETDADDDGSSPTYIPPTPIVPSPPLYPPSYPHYSPPYVPAYSPPYVPAYSPPYVPAYSPPHVPNSPYGYPYPSYSSPYGYPGYNSPYGYPYLSSYRSPYTYPYGSYSPYGSWSGLGTSPWSIPGLATWSYPGSPLSYPSVAGGFDDDDAYETGPPPGISDSDDS